MFDALRACWAPPGKDEARPGMQMSVRFAFKRSGEIIATPRVTYASPGVPPETRENYLRRDLGGARALHAAAVHRRVGRGRRRTADCHPLRRQPGAAVTNRVQVMSVTLTMVARGDQRDCRDAAGAASTPQRLGAALRACWVLPPGRRIACRHADHGADELPARRQPLRPAADQFKSAGASDDERLAYRIAVADMLKRCAPMPFTDALGDAVAGRPFTMRFIDSRKLKQAGNAS